MRNKILSVVVFGIAVALLAQPIEVSAQVGGSTTVRLDKIDNPPNTVIASNSSTAQIDFSRAPINDYSVKDLSTAITLQLTNLMPGRTARVWIDVDGTTRTVTVVTNGIPSGTEILWPWEGINTNGTTSFSTTNRTFLVLTVNPQTNMVQAVFRHLRP